MGQIDGGGKSTNCFLSPFKNAHSAFSFDCMIRKVFSDPNGKALPYQKYLARSCQDVSRFGKLARNLFQIHANFSKLQESFLSCKILVQNPCENLVLLDFWPDSCKILKRSCQDSFQDLGKIFFIGCARF